MSYFYTSVTQFHIQFQPPPIMMKLSTTSLLIFSVLVLVLGTSGHKSHEASDDSTLGEAEQKHGHHGKKMHPKEYAEEGHKNVHHHDDGDYAADHEQSHGEKPHHPKGHHNVHKLDELHKKKASFDEDHDAANKEKHDAIDFGKLYSNGEFKHGGHPKKGGHKAEHGGHKKAED